VILFYQLVTLFTEAMDETARCGKLGAVQYHLGYAKPCAISHLGDTFLIFFLKTQITNIFETHADFSLRE
jgi:hypothetical protein